MKVPEEKQYALVPAEGTGRINDKIASDLARFVCLLAVSLPDDVKKRLSEMALGETSDGAKKNYECMLENLRLAKGLKRPLCQDTGIPCFYIKAGSGFPYVGDVEAAVKKAAADAFLLVPLRPNAVDPYTGKNTGNNEGTCSPYIDWEIVPGDGLEITVYLMGGGSSLPGFAAVLTPGEGLEKAKQLIIEKILEKGVNACPPLIAGVGIGPSADIAAKLSKKALLRPLDSDLAEVGDAELAKELFDKLNGLEIGPGGLGGRESMIGVNVISGVRHPATFAVALSTGCWATRRGVIRFDKELNVSSPDHGDFV